MPETAMLPCPFRVPSVLGKRGRAIIREGPGPAALRERPQTRKHGERASSGAASSRRSVRSVSRQPRRREVRSTLERPKDGRILPELENPERMPMATTTIKRTTSAWAWQVITDDGRDCRQRARSSRAAIRTRRHEPVHRPGFADRRAWPTGRCSRFPVQTPRFGPDFVLATLETAILVPLTAVSPPGCP